MARRPRCTTPDQPQHVIQRGNNRTALFTQTKDYVFFLGCLASAVGQHGCLVHSFVLMTNHVHLLMTAETAGGIGRVMQSVGLRYVRYFNLKYGRTGTLWEGRYRAIVIDTQRYFFACSRYIELNPVRAGIVVHPSEYNWSSYGANALGRSDPLVVPHGLYTALGADAKHRQREYRALFDAPFDQSTIDALRGVRVA
jgi:putative transposase